MNKEMTRVDVRFIRKDDEKLGKVGFVSAMGTMVGIGITLIATVTGFCTEWRRTGTKRTKIIGEKDDIGSIFNDPNDGILVHPKETTHPEREP